MTTTTRTARVCAVDLHGLTLQIRCNDAGVHATVAARLAHLPAAAETAADLVVAYDVGAAPHVRPAGGRTVYESDAAEAVYSPAEEAFYAFHRDGPSLRCAAASGRAEIACETTGADQLWVLTRPLLTLALMELGRACGLYPVHAACLAHGDDGVIVCGASGSGKSTLTVALLRAGYAYVSDDLVFLRVTESGVSALGFPDELGLTADAHRLFAGLEGELTPPAGWPKARADVHRITPASTVSRSCTPRLALMLGARGHEPATRLRPDDALLELLPSMLMTDPATCSRHLGALSALTSSAPCVALPARPALGEALELVRRELGDPGAAA